MEIPSNLLEWMRTESIFTGVMIIFMVFWIVKTLWMSAKKIWPGLKNLVKFVTAWGALPEFMQETTNFMADARDRMDAQQQAIDIVRQEVLPNHGSSLRDESQTNALRLEKVEAKLVRDHERFAEVDAKLQQREVFQRSHGNRPLRETASPTTEIAIPEPTPFPADNTEE